MIEISALEAMFADIRKQTDWSIDGPMLWGYYFTDASPERLRALATRLETEGYRFVDIFLPGLDEGADEYYFLHVERVEPHTILSLHQRNQELDALADKLGIATYDGMDVGPLPNS